MSDLPHLPGVLTGDEVAQTASSIADLQLSTGMIPWFPDGHCDPWNHVETAMALDVAGLHAEAERAYEWLRITQRPDGSWHNYYWPDGSVKEHKLDTNVCAYVATGVWHHWLCTGDRGFLEHLWPTVDAALTWVLAMRRADGVPLWAREVDHAPWDYALLTGSSSIGHALDCGVRIAQVLNHDRRVWADARALIVDHLRHRPHVFEPKHRWAMDWYYPVIGGALIGDDARSRLASQWDAFVIPHKGVRCVSDEPWVTAAETAECALAFAAIGEADTAIRLLEWTRPHRDDDGAYWTGLVHPEGVAFPEGERTAYTGAAVILAADAVAGTTLAAGIFRHEPQ
jgi:hypothetical protein